VKPQKFQSGRVDKREALPGAPCNLVQKKTPSVIPNECEEFFKDFFGTGVETENAGQVR